MTTNVLRKELESAFQRIRGLDASLGEQLTAFAADARKRRPDLAEVVDRLVERLAQNGAGESAPKVGEPMPVFQLPDESNRLVSLPGLLVHGPVAITFHRGHWCPFCRISINALSRAHRRVVAEGGQIVAIMPERQLYASELKSAGEVPFPILTDMDNGYAMSLNLAIWVGDEMQAVMAARNNLAEFQGNDAWMLPIPATFVVGTDGLIKARFVDPDYRRRMAIDDLVAALQS
jgi:peroxiredoxin